MRVVWLCVLCFVTFLISIVVLFPASYVAHKIGPDLAPIALINTQGRLYKGTIDHVQNTDELLPLSFQNVRWTLAPLAILTGGGQRQRDRIRFVYHSICQP